MVVVNTAILANRRAAILDDLDIILEARPEDAPQLALDFCGRLTRRMDAGDLDRLRFEMHQKRAALGGDSQRGGNGSRGGEASA